ncbi:MAG: hypothetical protein ACOYD5_01440 [Negativicutes bacterium]|jgi:hypothetical protein
MDTVTNKNKNKSTQAITKEKYGQLTDVPAKAVDKDQLNQSMVP